jgi:hypothetical protein
LKRPARLLPEPHTSVSSRYCEERKVRGEGEREGGRVKEYQPYKQARKRKKERKAREGRSKREKI